MRAHGVTQRIRFVLLYIGGDYRCALMQQGERYRATQTAGAAGYESYFAAEFASHKHGFRLPNLTLVSTHLKV